MTFFDLLVRTEIHVWNALDADLASAGAVSLAQWQALRSVRAHDGLARVQDISADLSITAGAASKIVDRLERDGLAERRAHPSDRRSALVVLTDSGITALEEAQRIVDARLADLLGDIETGQAEAVLRLTGQRLGSEKVVSA